MKIIQLVVVIKPAMSAAVLATLFLLTPLAYSHSDSWTFSENNNKVILAQTKGGDATQAGDVKIEFYGHMAFKITSPDGIRILVDPWRNDPSGAWGLWFPGEFPAIPVYIVLSTLSTAEKWVERQQDVVRLKNPELVLNPDTVAPLNRRVYYFGMHHAKD